jgi:Sugar-specific transcriptional regulator TrmB
MVAYSLAHATKQGDPTMSALPGRWRPERLSAEVRRMAEAAAREAGLTLKPWLALTIRQASAAALAPPPAAPSGTTTRALSLLAETLKRADIAPLDEARAYLRLVSEFHMSADEIAAAVNRPRDRICRSLRLLKLPQRVRELIEQGALAAGHADALVNAPDQESLAQAVHALALADETRARASRERAPPPQEAG